MRQTVWVELGGRCKQVWCVYVCVCRGVKRVGERGGSGGVTREEARVEQNCALV